MGSTKYSYTAGNTCSRMMSVKVEFQIRLYLSKFKFLAKRQHKLRHWKWKKPNCDEQRTWHYDQVWSTIKSTMKSPGIIRAYHFCLSINDIECYSSRTCCNWGQLSTKKCAHIWTRVRQTKLKRIQNKIYLCYILQFRFALYTETWRGVFK